jgi:hypothetical protein
VASRRTYLIFGSFCFAMFVFVWFFVPETKGISLEHMDALFGVTDESKPLTTEQVASGDEKVKENANGKDQEKDKDAPHALQTEVA